MNIFMAVFWRHVQCRPAPPLTRRRLVPVVRKCISRRFDNVDVITRDDRIACLVKPLRLYNERRSRCDACPPAHHSSLPYQHQQQVG